MHATSFVLSPASDLMAAVAPRITALARHPVWSTLRDRASLVRFMESHVYCVWDFMSLLKSLQGLATGVGVPWRPVGEPHGSLAPMVARAAAAAGVPEAAADFMRSTFTVIDRGRPWEIAAAFGIGREQAIPDMFASTLAAVGRGARCSLFAEYLERHVELDGDEHGPMVLELIAALCGDGERRRSEARAAAVEALEARGRLWDRLARQA